MLIVQNKLTGKASVIIQESEFDDRGKIKNFLVDKFSIYKNLRDIMLNIINKRYKTIRLLWTEEIRIVYDI